MRPERQRQLYGEPYGQAPQQRSLARIGNAERDRAAELLADHYAAGRLDHDEYSERLDAIWSAKTRPDLDDLFWDLPRPVAPPAPPATVGRRRSPVPPALLVALLVVVSVVLFEAFPWWLVVAGVVYLATRNHRGWRC